MHTKRLAWALAVLAWSMPAAAHAYCVSQRPFEAGWQFSFPDLRIPVRINISDYGVHHAGLSTDEAIALVEEVIARHNEVGVGPKLYYAGQTAADWAPGLTPSFTNLPAGITIMSYSCAEEPICGDGAEGCAAFSSHPVDLRAIGRVFLAPRCNDNNKASFSLTAYPDPAQVLLHEIGHTLGLEHTNQTSMQCSGLAGNSPAGNEGVMHSVVPGIFSRVRSWRRDDIEAFQTLYSADSITGEKEITWWEDSSYPAYPTELSGHSVARTPAGRSAVISNAAESSIQAFASVAPDGRVVHGILDEHGHVTPGPADRIVDPGDGGISFATPAVALAPRDDGTRIFVAWLANEASTAYVTEMRVGTRPLDSLDWSFSEHPDPFSVPRLSAGYSVALDTLIVTTLSLDSRVSFVLFDADGEPLGPAIVLPQLEAFDVGAPECLGSRCLVPYSHPKLGGPKYGVAIVEVMPESNAVEIIDFEHSYEQNSRGRPGVVGGPDDPLGFGGSSRFFLGQVPGLSPDMIPKNDDEEWPLGVGAWGEGEDRELRLFSLRPVECGNGITQGTEQCDDGNHVQGDGCFNCLSEDGESSETGSTDEDGGATTGETGGAELPSDGCNCKTTRSRDVDGWLMPLLVGWLLSLRRARRGYASANSGRVMHRRRRP